ncbi:MAG: HAMP domain-containing histidine kinase [Nitrospirae bacterium]|nr:HAMP domain-containing histidine kinase [Nitrospirota bacterium]
MITVKSDDIHEAYRVYGYPNEFKQVILNIISNSRDVILNRRKFVLMGSSDVGTIIITLKKEDGKIITLISDNGGGIPDTIAGSIFEYYFTTKSDMEGTGIGLYMSKMIIEKSMDGSLTFRNTGDGAEFRIAV